MFTLPLLMALACQVDPQVAVISALATVNSKKVVIDVEVSAVVAPGVPTKKELVAIDKRFWDTHHWELCPGSCGMLCKDYHPAWKVVDGPDPASRAIAGGGQVVKNRADQDKTPPSANVGGGCPGGKCKLKLFKAIKQRIKGG